MSLVTLNPVRYYTADDVFHYTVDNRPLQDLAANDVLLQETIDEYLGAALVINGTSPDAGTITGAEIFPVTRGAGLLQTTISKVATWILGQICPSVATFASLPSAPRGFYLILADETKSGGPTMYFFTSSNRYWIAMTQDS